MEKAIGVWLCSVFNFIIIAYLCIELLELFSLLGWLSKLMVLVLKFQGFIFIFFLSCNNATIGDEDLNLDFLINEINESRQYYGVT